MVNDAHEDKTLGLINTHLTWDPPTTTPGAQRGLRQVQQVLAEYQSRLADADAWIISGDFNVTPESEVVALVLQAGLQYAHHDLLDVFSCNIGGSARLIDYLFYSGGVNAKASVLRRINGQTDFSRRRKNRRIMSPSWRGSIGRAKPIDRAAKWCEYRFEFV